MFVIYEPGSIDLLETNRDAHPVRSRLSGGLSAAYAIQTVRDGSVDARRNFQPLSLTADWSSEGAEPLRQILSDSLFTPVFERRRQVKLHNVLGVM